jgi:hypothetical protein
VQASRHTIAVLQRIPSVGPRLIAAFL